MDQELQERFDDVLSALHEAREAAEIDRNDAWDRADSAQDAADSASSYAYDAKQECENLESRLEGMKEQLGVLSALLEELQNEGKGSLAGDMAKHGPAVRMEAKNGLSPAEIASRLNIGEFLVTQILQQQQAA